MPSGELAAAVLWKISLVPTTVVMPVAPTSALLACTAGMVMAAAAVDPSADPRAPKGAPGVGPAPPSSRTLWCVTSEVATWPLPGKAERQG